MIRRYRDRADAGRALADHLATLGLSDDAVVLALPRGGLPVAAEVAGRLGLPLDVLVVRKLGLPQQPELAMGAIASGGVRVLNDDVVRAGGVDPGTIEEVARREEAELRRREAAYRGRRTPLELEGRTVLIVDDGLATGATMRAAVEAARRRSPARVVVAVPVAAADTCEAFLDQGIEVACPAPRRDFVAVGACYDHFPQTSDAEVTEILREAAVPGTGAVPGAGAGSIDGG